MHSVDTGEYRSQTDKILILQTIKQFSTASQFTAFWTFAHCNLAVLCAAASKGLLPLPLCFICSCHEVSRVMFFQKKVWWRTFCSKSSLEANRFSFTSLKSLRLFLSVFLSLSSSVNNSGGSNSHFGNSSFICKSVWPYVLIHWQIPPPLLLNGLWRGQMQPHLSAMPSRRLFNPIYVELFRYLPIYTPSAGWINSKQRFYVNSATTLDWRRFLHSPDVKIFSPSGTTFLSDELIT